MSEIEAPVADPTPAPEAEAAKPDRTFTPDDVERIVRERLARERAKYQDFDVLKEKAEKYDQVQAEQMSEVEKAQQAAREAAERASALEAELNSAKRLDGQRKVLAELGFDAPAIENLAGRLDGDDDAAWKADAEKFLPYMKAGKPAPPTAANHLEPLPESEDAQIRAAIRRGAGLT